MQFDPGASRIENEGLANNFMKEGKIRDLLVTKQALGRNG